MLLYFFVKKFQPLIYYHHYIIKRLFYLITATTRRHSRVWQSSTGSQGTRQLANAHILKGDYARGCQLIQQALVVFQALGDWASAAVALQTLIAVAGHAGPADGGGMQKNGVGASGSAARRRRARRGLEAARVCDGRLRGR
jgi:hypothetical protein